MKYQSNTNAMAPERYTPAALVANEMMAALQKTEIFKTFIQQFPLPNLEDLLSKLIPPTGKKSFLVFKNNKYISLRTEDIALFQVKYDSTMIKAFDRQEYFLNCSLDQIQTMLMEKDFYRLNRQFLIGFNAIKEVEHYFSRKLLVNLIFPVEEKLLVPKDKASSFLQWLDHR
jgi:two-component system response regulator LytT